MSSSNHDIIIPLRTAPGSDRVLFSSEVYAGLLIEFLLPADFLFTVIARYDQLFEHDLSDTQRGVSAERSSGHQGPVVDAFSQHGPAAIAFLLGVLLVSIANTFYEYNKTARDERRRKDLYATELQAQSLSADELNRFFQDFFQNADYAAHPLRRKLSAISVVAKDGTHYLALTRTAPVVIPSKTGVLPFLDRNIVKPVMTYVVDPLWDCLSFASYAYWILWIGAGIKTGVFGVGIAGLSAVAGFGIPLAIGAFLYLSSKLKHWLITQHPTALENSVADWLFKKEFKTDTAWARLLNFGLGLRTALTIPYAIGYGIYRAGAFIAKKLSSAQRQGYKPVPTEELGGGAAASETTAAASELTLTASGDTINPSSVRRSLNEEEAMLVLAALQTAQHEIKKRVLEAKIQEVGAAKKYSLAVLNAVAPLRSKSDLGLSAAATSTTAATITDTTATQTHHSKAGFWIKTRVALAGFTALIGGYVVAQYNAWIAGDFIQSAFGLAANTTAAIGGLGIGLAVIAIFSALRRMWNTHRNIVQEEVALRTSTTTALIKLGLDCTNVHSIEDMRTALQKRHERLSDLVTGLSLSSQALLGPIPEKLTEEAPKPFWKKAITSAKKLFDGAMTGIFTARLFAVTGTAIALPFIAAAALSNPYTIGILVACGVIYGSIKLAQYFIESRHRRQVRAMQAVLTQAKKLDEFQEKLILADRLSRLECLSPVTSATTDASALETKVSAAATATTDSLPVIAKTDDRDAKASEISAAPATPVIPATLRRSSSVSATFFGNGGSAPESKAAEHDSDSTAPRPGATSS